ncbi:ABC-F family ATP-binding cassette domain-containing protein [Spiroplasma endosymbiont of Aspidapion aeneum]|uniref:ABC-F family ATP-binding cassette domain-containing protein n=1 Tax=Spiroplasma endosymbiont of Aspidapion aeneum TaxID=3066276 RepID=UPI00313CC97D
MSLVVLKELSHQNGGKILYKNSNMRINRGEHVALLGPNGSGKTTLLNIISQKITPDDGDVVWHPKARIGYLDQHQDVDLTLTTEQYLKDAFKELYEIEAKIHKIYEDMAIEYSEDELVKALELQNKLDHSNFSSIDKVIGNLIFGLGIDSELINRELGSLSGGQRGKIILAKLLLKNDDFILLDEPTNFLDVEQVNWLIGFLQSYENAFLVVSHDKDFVNKIVNIIYSIENRELVRYVGNYDKYLELSSQRAGQHDKAIESQQKQISKLKEYISKNAARASTARSAQSRQKQLSKMEIIDKRQAITKPKMKFKYKRPSCSVILRAKDLQVGYTNSLIGPLNFDLKEGEKCIVKGYNGIGKTTFLKTIANEISTFSGESDIGEGVEINFFHQNTEIEDNETPVTYLMRRHPKMLEGEVRATIGKFGVKGELMQNKMKSLSGGEQTKVRLASLSLKPSSLLILDEPTNHIDVMAKDSLLDAIQQYEGAVLITTHDINFETKWADKILNFEELTTK